MEKINFQNNVTKANAETMTQFQDNIENAINEVIESGSNENGSYIKYSNGTMICYKTLTGKVDILTSTMDGAFYYGAVDLGNMPQTFLTRPTIIVSPQTQSGTQYFLSGTVGTSYGTNSSFGQVSLLRPSTRTELAYILDVVAIGNWK